MLDNEKLIHQFDAYCKRTLRNERIDYYRQKQYRMNHEVLLSDLEERLLEKYFATNDTYMLGDTFTVLGHEIEVCDGKHCIGCRRRNGRLY